MLRRKNNEYGNTHPNQSPYRFQRKNQNVSPGLSPMRCRTPTRISHISPLRGGNANDNFRGHSPIKFVNNRTNKQNTVGFFRNDTSSNLVQGHNQKYATCTTKNDHSFKRQVFQEHGNNSRIRPAQQNSDRTMLHENTKLFSKLVEKLNSQKKKQPQLVKKHTKPSEPVAVESKTKCSQKTLSHKPSTQKQKIQPFVNQITAVESVVYESKKYKTEVQEKYPKKSNQLQKNIYQPTIINQSSTFDDVKMYLGKLTQSSTYFNKHKKDESLGNNSDIYSNMNGSMMNMDPFI